MASTGVCVIYYAPICTTRSNKTQRHTGACHRVALVMLGETGHAADAIAAGAGAFVHSAGLQAAVPVALLLPPGGW